MSSSVVCLARHTQEPPPAARITDAGASGYSSTPLGEIFLSTNTSVVSPSADPAAPSFAIDVRTPQRIFTLVPDGGVASHEQWLALLADAVDGQRDRARLARYQATHGK